MKYLIVLLLGLVLGAVAYRQVSITYTPAPGVAPVVVAATPPVPVEREVIRPVDGMPPPAPVAAAPPREIALPSAPASGTVPARAGESGLLIPVQGMAAKDLADTFTDARSEGRSHDAIDIMAAAGTPVLAVADGHVEKLFDSKRGGLTVYQFEPSGQYAYYYAHLQRYAAGLAEKQQITRGQVIGYVGSTGNASPDGPHLHFAIFELGPERRWWEGTALNPYPLLAGKTVAQPAQ